MTDPLALLEVDNILAAAIRRDRTIPDPEWQRIHNAFSDRGSARTASARHG